MQPCISKPMPQDPPPRPHLLPEWKGDPSPLLNQRVMSPGHSHTFREYQLSTHCSQHGPRSMKGVSQALRETHRQLHPQGQQQDPGQRTGSHPGLRQGDK